LLLLVTVSGQVSAQSGSVRQSSIEAFEKGRYEDAYDGFTELLQTYPKDPLYKYYRGVCLIRLNREPEEALALLQQARQGNTGLRLLPQDSQFWLARALHMNGRFSEAVDAYNSFTLQSGKKAARDLDVPGYIQQCQDKKGAITASVSEPAPKNDADLKNRNAELRQTERKQNLPPAEVKADPIPEDLDGKLSEALDYQFRADSVTGIADKMKKDSEALDYKSRMEARTGIAEKENLAALYRKKADEKIGEAHGSLKADSLATAKIPEKPAGKPSEKAIPQEPERKIAAAEPSAPVVKEASAQVTQDIFSVFEIEVAGAAKAAKVEVNPVIPPGLIYRIQVAVFSKPVTASYFKGIGPIYGFRNAGTNNTAYYAGMFRRNADARKALARVKQTGFRDAFLVAFSEGRQVSLEKAAALEKEWGRKPFLQAGQNPADTIPPELCFRVEIMRSARPVKPDVLKSMNQAAGTRGLDTEKTAAGTMVYLIGKFITYESAARYADLLVRNGYREAKVVARLGKKEVPVETARKLFEMQ
jgi:tetratricopeptide (TPR) repeat protein